MSKRKCLDLDKLRLSLRAALEENGVFITEHIYKCLDDLADAVEDADMKDHADEIDLFSIITDYCRFEAEDDTARADVMSEWLADLRAVGVEDVDENATNSGHACEVRFNVTLEQAFRLATERDWDWHRLSGGAQPMATYLAAHMLGVSHLEDQAPYAKRIEELWELYQKEHPRPD